jgi:hypothetical protein
MNRGPGITALPAQIFDNLSRRAAVEGDTFFLCVLPSGSGESRTLRAFQQAGGRLDQPGKGSHNEKHHRQPRPPRAAQKTTERGEDQKPHGHVISGSRRIRRHQRRYNGAARYRQSDKQRAANSLLPAYGPNAFR